MHWLQNRLPLLFTFILCGTDRDTTMISLKFFLKFQWNLCESLIFILLKTQISNNIFIRLQLHIEMQARTLPGHWKWLIYGNKLNSSSTRHIKNIKPMAFRQKRSQKSITTANSSVQECYERWKVTKTQCSSNTEFNSIVICCKFINTKRKNLKKKHNYFAGWLCFGHGHYAIMPTQSKTAGWSLVLISVEGNNKLAELLVRKRGKNVWHKVFFFKLIGFFKSV